MLASSLLSRQPRGSDQEPDPLREGRPASRRQFRASGPPPATFSVTALAVADRWANAVGPVRLTCEARGLRLELIQVGRFAQGFAFAGLADAVSFTVPYRAVRGMVQHGRALHLSLDPHAATPYNRFALSHFAAGPPRSLLWSLRLRSWALVVVALLALAGGVAVALTVARAESSAPSWAPWALGALCAVVIHPLLQRLVRRLTAGGQESDRLRARFERIVAAQLGLEVAPELGPQRPVEGPVVHVGQLMGKRGRRWALAVSLASVGASVAVLTVRELGVRPERIFAAPLLRVGFAPRVRRVGDLAIKAADPKLPVCACRHPDAAMWREAFDELAILVQPVVPPRGRTGPTWLHVDQTYPLEALGEDEAVELDLAVVNNGRRTFEEIDLILTFARRDGAGQRGNLVERGLHWPRNLGPGDSVKWRVEAIGTEMKVEGRYDRRVGLEQLAPAQAFDDLADARLPMVRLHAAVMLAYAGHERGYQRAAALSDLPPAGQEVQRQLAASRAPLRLCNLEVVPTEGVRACLFNGSDRLHRSLVVRAVGGEVAPVRIDDIFVAGTGLQIRVPGTAAATASYVVDAP